MAVANSYKTDKLCGDPYFKDGKAYVKVLHECGRCGGTGHYSYDGRSTVCYECRGAKRYPKEVRWYTDSEFASMARAQEKAKIQRQEKRDAAIKAKKAAWPERNGFKDGRTWVILGDTYSIKEELKEAGCKFAGGLGWHCVPGSVEGYEVVEIEIDEVADETEWGYEWKEEKEIKAAVRAKMPKPESTSTFQGEIGQRITRSLKVIRVVDVSGRYSSSMYVMEDEGGNVYIWFTSAVDWEAGSSHVVTGTIKDHKEYNGIAQTILTRCRESK